MSCNVSIHACFNLGNRGQPEFKIETEQMAFLMKLNIPIRDIARVMSVSISTIRRAMMRSNLSVRAQYSNISDRELLH